MMERTHTHAVDRTPVPDADVCIIGSGLAGTFLSYSLASRGHDVVVLEAGKRFDFDEEGMTAEYLERAVRPDVSNADMWGLSDSRDGFTHAVPSHIPFDLNERRVKAVGGTSLAWNGTVTRFLEKDFEMASRYGVGTDWPISYEDLRPYYAQAEQEMGVAGEEGPLSPPRENPFPMEPFPLSELDELYVEACEQLGISIQRIPHARNTTEYDGRSVCEGYGTCSPFCPTRARYDGLVHIRRAEERGARVIDRAPVQALEHGRDGERVTAAVYETSDGEQHRQEATHFVVACGPVETPRLLLLSDSDQYPDGLANTSGAVGRYFQAKTYVNMRARRDEPTQPTQTGFDTTMSHEFCEPEDDSIGSIWLVFRNDDPVPIVERALTPNQFTELTGNPWGDDLLGQLQAADPAGFSNVRISAYLEQLPLADNRVTLDDSTTDSYGNPVPHIEFEFTERTERTMERALEIQRDILGAMDVHDISGDDSLRRLSTDHKGTTRMGSNPDESVVNGEGRTHDLQNLWIAGPSVFTTGSAVEPGLTVAALALKTADHIHETLE